VCCKLAGLLAKSVKGHRPLRALLVEGIEMERPMFINFQPPTNKAMLEILKGPFLSWIIEVLIPLETTRSE